MATEAPITLDCSGKSCPVPIVELARALKKAQAGAVVLLVSTDPAVEPDVRAFCQATGHPLERLEETGGIFRAWVRKPGR